VMRETFDPVSRLVSVFLLCENGGPYNPFNDS
jgi:hypothetical protein